MYMNLQVALTPCLYFAVVNFPELEDTFILLDALEADTQDLKNDHPLICLEIGYY